MGDWSFGDDGESESQHKAEPVSDDDRPGFWAPGATRRGKLLVSVLFLVPGIVIAWHVYGIVTDFFRALS